MCEAHFKRSYGPNLDRVVSLKGNAVNERALIMRLHLLQAVLHFHQNMRSKACDLFDSVELEWQRLQISDESVRMMVDMGRLLNLTREFNLEMLRFITEIVLIP